MVCKAIILMGFLSNLTTIDKMVIRQARKTCETRYKSCVKSIKKKSKDNYNVLCGDLLND